MGVSVQGEILDLVNTINGMIDQLAMFSAEVTKVAREVGTEGKLGVQAEVGSVQGEWQEITYVPLFIWSEFNVNCLMFIIFARHLPTTVIASTSRMCFRNF